MAILQKGQWGNNLFNQLFAHDYGITERLGIGRPNPAVTQGGALFSPPRVLAMQSSQPNYNVSQAPRATNTGQQYGPALPAGFQSGGQPSSGGQSGAPAGAPQQGPQQQQGPSQDEQYLNQLRSTFGGLRSDIEGLLPGLENTYNTAKTGIEGSVQRARETLGEQKQDINRGFGENLRQLLQSDRELGQKQRGVYSGLNALDSSSFADAEIKRQQNVFDTQNEFTREKDRSITSADRQFSGYEQEANNQLATLGSQYLQGKQQLQSAIAQNDLNSASAIQNAMDQIRNRAQQVQSAVDNLKLQALSLQSQGTDVVGGLQRLNRSGIDQMFGNYLNNFYNPAAGALTIPSQTMPGQGFIDNSEEERRRRGLL